jgi:uncharacterized membrane protein
MSLYELFKTIHILGAVAWGGAVIVTQFLGFLATSSGNQERMLGFVEDQTWLGKHYFAPTAVTVLLAGIAMVIQSGWEFTDPWIVIGLVLFFATVFLGMFVLGPQGEKLSAAIRERGLQDPEVQAQGRKLANLSRIDLVLLVVVIADMVIKPGS